MRLAMVTVFTLFVCGCGGVDFTGTFKGPVTLAATTCSDGSALAAESAELALSIKQPHPEEIDFDGSPNCPGVRGTVSGNTATVQKITCTPRKLDNGATLTTTISGGTVAANGSSITLSLALSILVNLPSGASGTCTTTETGTLAKQP